MLQDGLESCASLELWLLYLERVRRSAVAGGGGGRTEQEARDDTVAAFELALLHVGCNPASTPLWQSYLDYIKSWEERSPLDKGNKMTAIRKASKAVPPVLALALISVMGVGIVKRLCSHDVGGAMSSTTSQR